MFSQNNKQQMVEEDDLIQFSSDSSSDEECFNGCSSMPIKRMAIIDTCNLMFACAGMALSTNPTAHLNEKNVLRRPDALGILLIVKQLLKEGYDVRMFVPISYMSSKNATTIQICAQIGGRLHSVLFTNFKQLHKLEYLTIIDDGSHDDLVILEMAKSVGGFVISNDRFRDHSQTVQTLLKVIQTRTVLCSFERIQQVTRDFICHPNNRYFFGMRVTLRPNKKAMFAENNDPSFAMAFSQRLMRSEEKSQKALEVLGVLADFAKQKLCANINIAPPILDYFDPRDDELPDDFEEFLSRYRFFQSNQLSEEATAIFNILKNR